MSDIAAMDRYKAQALQILLNFGDQLHAPNIQSDL